MRRIYLSIAVVTLCFNAPLTWAQSLPIPASKDEILNRPTVDLLAQRDREQKLRKTLSKIDDEIEGLRTSMVRVAGNVKRQERDLNKLEDKIDALQAKRKKINTRLEAENQDIAVLAMALVRLRAVPPEAIIARPGASIDTAEAAMILRNVSAPLRARALSLATDLEELAGLEAELITKKKTMEQAAAKIMLDQTKLADLVRRRESAYQGLQNDLAAQEQELAALAQDASDFKDLIGKLEKRNQELAQSSGSPSLIDIAIPKKPQTLAARALGDPQIPMEGPVRLKYGAQDDMGSESQGIRIEGRTGALVVAPMNGIIRYKGRFKTYGNMVIIEHAKNYHSLVAGLTKVDTVVGQSVVAGEPLGVLGQGGGARPTVYFELRQNGKPINPAKLFPNLG